MEEDIPDGKMTGTASGRRSVGHREWLLMEQSPVGDHKVRDCVYLIVFVTSGFDAKCPVLP